MNQLYSKSVAYTSINPRIYEYLLLSGPFIALIGNAPSDIWLSLCAIFFLVQSAINRDWSWSRQVWFRISLLFWLWLVLVTFISEWPEISGSLDITKLPKNILERALPWIRFPVFAAALMKWLGESERLRQQMLYAILLGVTVLAIILIVERIQNPEAIRLYGTWAQSTKPGWYMLGFGLPALLWILMEFRENTQSAIWGIPLFLLIFCATVATGEIYVTMSMIFGFFLFVTLSRFWSWRVLYIAAGCLAAGLAVIATNSDLLYRFTGEILVRLPWLPTSDYYDAWTGGFNTGLKNPFLGIGADNYEDYCNELSVLHKLAVLGVKKCMAHPHNLYLQAFAETGAPGLVLFSALALSLVRYVRASGVGAGYKIHMAMATALIIVVMWPVSTYSQAFGQHKNLFTWFLIGWALATAHFYANLKPHLRK